MLVVFETIILSLLKSLTFINLAAGNLVVTIFVISYVIYKKCNYETRTENLPTNKEITTNTNEFSTPPLNWAWGICFGIILIIKARFLLFGISNNAYLGGLDDPAFHINYALEIVHERDVFSAFQKELFGLKYPFGFHSLIAFLTIISGLPVIHSTRIMVFLFYSFLLVTLVLPQTTFFTFIISFS